MAGVVLILIDSVSFGLILVTVSSIKRKSTSFLAQRPQRGDSISSASQDSAVVDWVTASTSEPLLPTLSVSFSARILGERKRAAWNNGPGDAIQDDASGTVPALVAAASNTSRPRVFGDIIQGEDAVSVLSEGTVLDPLTEAPMSSKPPQSTDSFHIR
jgi:hypothetical protein